jgi:serine/threonine protein phosphatase PrpC
MTLALRYAVRSDVGLLREGNEDSAYAGPHLLAVADGMGGHAAGEVASAATITTIASLDSDRTISSDPTEAGLVGALADAVVSANVRLQELIIADPATEGMGTTLTAILWSDGHAAVCHIGDSRGYLLRSGQFYQITHDHTLVQSLVDEGKITEDEIATHPHRSLLLRALDGRNVAEPDLSVHETMPGDRYMLCSDGLSGVVTEQTLRQTLSTVWDPDKAALQLIELAIKGGGPDNITCIVADVIDTQSANVAPTRNATFAGAAANGAPSTLPPGTLGAPGNPAFGGPQGGPGGPQGAGSPQRPSSPATRAMNLTRTKPQPSLREEDDLHAWGGPGFDEEEDFRAGGTGPRSTTGPRGTGSHANGSRGNAGGGRRGRQNQFDDDEYDAPRAKRRWPIVSGILVLLVLVVAGGLVAGWQYVQGQYYIGEHNGNVAIFRGVDQDVAGINLSSLVQDYPSLPVSLLVSGDQAQVSQTISYSSQQKAQTVVSQLQQSVSQCRQGYAALTAWQAQNTSYQRALASYNRLPAAQKRTAKKPTQPPAEPAVPSAAKCAPASAFGISASALPGATSSTSGSSTGGETPASSPSAKASAPPATTSSAPTSRATTPRTTP